MIASNTEVLPEAAPQLLEMPIEEFKPGMTLVPESETSIT